MIDSNELKAIKKVANRKHNTTYFSLRYDMINHLKETNDKIKSAGGGYAGVLIPSHRDYVIKWTHRGDNDSYKAYARYCMKYGHLHPTLPKIFAMFSNKYFDFYIIEKLTYVPKVSSRFVKDYVELDARGELFVSKYNPLADVLGKVKQISNRYGSSQDIGTVNIMCRKDGTAVLTDPLAD